MTRPTPVADNSLVRAASALATRLREIHDDPEFISVWTIAHMHRGPYEGPTYVKELEDLEAAIAEWNRRAALPGTVQPVAVEEPVAWQNLSCDEQFALATRIAGNIGYDLTPEHGEIDAPSEKARDPELQACIDAASKAFRETFASFKVPIDAGVVEALTWCVSVCDHALMRYKGRVAQKIRREIAVELARRKALAAASQSEGAGKEKAG